LLIFRSLNRYKQKNSSSPSNIYNGLCKDVNSGDLHSSRIKENRAGLKKGALIHLENKLIDDDDFARIVEIIDRAETCYFRPLLYIIPILEIKERITLVHIDSVANPLSIEYQIADLKTNECDIIELNFDHA